MAPTDQPPVIAPAPRATRAWPIRSPEPASTSRRSTSMIDSPASAPGEIVRLEQTVARERFDENAGGQRPVR